MSTPTYLDDYVDDFYVSLDDSSHLVAHSDDYDVYSDYSSFFDLVEAHAIYAESSTLESEARRIAATRDLDHAYRSADNAQRKARHQAARAADADAVRAADRERQRRYRAKKRLEAKEKS